MRLSIIIPAFNASAHIERCLYSVLRQEIDSYEVIVVNDGSEDNSYEIAEHFKINHRNGDRLILITQENRGVSCARNHGMDIAKGDYVAFVDADDELVGAGYKGLLEAASSNGDPDLVIGGIEEVKEYGAVIPHTPDKNIFEGGESRQLIFRHFAESPFVGGPWGKLFKRRTIDEYAIRFPTDMVKHEDSYLLYDFISHAKRMLTANTITYRYFLYSSNCTARFHLHQEIHDLRKYIDKQTEVLELFESSFQKELAPTLKHRHAFLWLQSIYGLYKTHGIDNHYQWLRAIAVAATETDPEWKEHFTSGNPLIFRIMAMCGSWHPHIVLSAISKVPMLKKRLRG